MVGWPVATSICMPPAPRAEIAAAYGECWRARGHTASVASAAPSAIAAAAAAADAADAADARTAAAAAPLRESVSAFQPLQAAPPWCRCARTDTAFQGRCRDTVGAPAIDFGGSPSSRPFRLRRALRSSALALEPLPLALPTPILDPLRPSSLARAPFPILPLPRSFILCCPRRLGTSAFIAALCSAAIRNHADRRGEAPNTLRQGLPGTHCRREVRWHYFALHWYRLAPIAPCRSL